MNNEILTKALDLAKEELIISKALKQANDEARIAALWAELDILLEKAKALYVRGIDTGDTAALRRVEAMAKDIRHQARRLRALEDRFPRASRQAGQALVDTERAIRPLAGEGSRG